MVQPLWKTVCRFLGKLNLELPYDPEIPLLGLYAYITTIQKDASTPMFFAAVFIIPETWKKPKCPSPDEWIDMVPIYNENLLSHKKEQNNATHSHMDVTREHHSK